MYYTFYLMTANITIFTEILRILFLIIQKQLLDKLKRGLRCTQHNPLSHSLM